MALFRHVCVFTGYRPTFRLLGRAFLVAVLIFTLAVPVSLTLAPQKAEAGTRVVIECCANLATNIITTIKNIAKVLKEFGLDTIAWVIAQKLIQKMTADLVKWVQRGFDGAPAFATDFEGFLLDTANAVAGDYILNNQQLAWLCSPFSFDIRFTLAIQMQQFRKRTPQCTLTGVVKNIDQFLSGDFFSGRWEGFFKLTQQPTNNIYGSYIIARGGLLEKLTGQKEKKMNLLDWGHGFLAWTECSTGFTKQKQGQDEICVADTPTVEYDIDGNPFNSYEQKETTTQTPGKAIEGQLYDSLTKNSDKLVTADEINEIIGALASQLVVMTFESAGGLFKADTKRSGNQPSILDQLRNEKPEDYQTQKEPDDNQIRTDLQADTNKRLNNFRYSLTPESPPFRVNPGGTRSTHITKTLLGGSSRSVTHTVSNESQLSAAGITLSSSDSACAPTCIVGASITTSATTPLGTHPIIITGDPAPDGGDLTINLEVTSAADTSAPSVTGITVDSSLFVTVTAGDDFGVTGVTLSVDIGGFGLGSFSDVSFPYDFDATSVLNTPDTTYTLTATAVDAAGNVSAPATATYTSPP